MAFTKKLIEQSGGPTVSSDGKVVSTYTHKYLCENNGGGYLTLDQVVQRTGFKANQPYADNIAAGIRKVIPTRLFHHDPQYAWTVDVEWSTDVPQAAEDPSDRPVLRRVYASETQRYIFRDSSNNIILNSAGDPPDGGIPVNHHMPAINWKRNEDDSGFSTQRFQTLHGKLNSTSFACCSPGTLILVAEADETYEGKYHFWACNYTMVYNDQGWQPQFVNAGLQELKVVSGTTIKVPILDDQKQPVQNPEPLYGPGANVGKKVPISARPGSCNWITVTYSGTMDFSSLLLPL